MKFIPLRAAAAVLPALSLVNVACSLPIIDATNTTSSQKTVWYGDKQITYYTQGPSQGPLLIFLHGWPGIAETWRPQIDYFADLGYYVVTPDMPGYGRSTARMALSDYAHENIVPGLLAMLEDTGRTSAVWIGHDWGAGVASSLVAVHPEVVDAMAWLTVPYKTIELGIPELLQYVNRTVYPESEFYYGQWDYMRFYETNFSRVTDVFESDYGYTIKALFAASQANESIIGTHSFSSHITRDGGWFGGVDQLPPADTIPLNATLLDQHTYDALVTAMENTTFGPADGYYANHVVNRAYNLDHQKNDGVLDIPCLFIEARYDLVLATVDSDLLSPMPAHCRNFAFASIPAGHWVAHEQPEMTNQAIDQWLAKNVTTYLPSRLRP